MRNISYSLLDNIWLNEGIAKCQDFFNNSVKQNRNLASKLINDTRISFPCFYVLMPILKDVNIIDVLNKELKAAFSFTENILTQSATNIKENAANKAILKWIFETSYNISNLGSAFNEIIDVTVSVLVNSYREITITNKIADLLFKRNRASENIHELAWSYFRIGTPMTLKLIAQRLKSSNALDVKFAKTLLNIDKDSTKDYATWITKNESFIYFTGESFQYSSKPEIFKVDYGRKYLLKRNKSNTFSNSETEILNKFNELDKNEQDVLSEYSFALSKNGIDNWSTFIGNDISTQLKKAKEVTTK